MKVVLSCLNAVFTEKILKQCSDTPLVHQIVHMKVFWCLWSVLIMGLMEGPGVYMPSRFFNGWGTGVLLVIATYVIKNWSGTFLLKRLDSLLKNVAEAFAMIVLYILELSPIVGQQKKFELPTFMVTILVVLLVWSYLESKKRSHEKSTGRQIGFSELLEKMPQMWQRVNTSPNSMGRRLGKKYGLIPSMARPSSQCKIVANKNVDLPIMKPASKNNFLPKSGSMPHVSAQASMMKSARSMPSVAAQQNIGHDDDLEKGTDLNRAEASPARRNSRGEASDNPTYGLLDTVEMLLGQAVEGNGDQWKFSVKQALDLCKGLRPYLETVNSKVSPHCEAVCAETKATDWQALYKLGLTKYEYNAQMMATQTQAQMLSFFVSMLSARRVLELGIFTGFSTLCMAEATQEKGKVVAIEKDPYLIEFAKRHFEKSPHGHKIELVAGNALDVLSQMQMASDDEDRYDLIFIDGDKTEYAQYFQLLNDRDLLAPGGLICIDDCLWKGCVYTDCNDGVNVDPTAKNGAEYDRTVATAMRDLNNMIHSDPRLVSVLIPIRNGLSLVRRVDDQTVGERDHFMGELPKIPPRRQAMQRRGISQAGLSAPHQDKFNFEAAHLSSPKENAELLPDAQSSNLNDGRQWTGGSEDSLPIAEIGEAERLQTC